MHAKETNEIRGLTAAELDEVSGGLDPLSMLVGAAVALTSVVVIELADRAGVFDAIPVGDVLSGKGRPA